MIHLNEIKKRVQPILEKYGIEKAGIFGSAARKKSEANDIDLLVKIEQKISLLDFIGIQQELEDELKMKVDLVEYDSLKPALREEVLKEEVPILRVSTT
jgi:predicted nucleotidyltransferase